jgi:hypothetical protein
MLLLDSCDKPHIQDDRLELYLLKHTLTTSERAKIEEHFLCCRHCVSRKEQVQEFIFLLRAALRAERRSDSYRVIKTALQA